MRKQFGKTLTELGNRDPNLVVLYGDVCWPRPENDFISKYPERALNVGIGEQAMVGMAAGMASKMCLGITFKSFKLFRKKA